MLEHIKQLLLNNPYIDDDERVLQVKNENGFRLVITTNKRTYNYSIEDY